VRQIFRSKTSNVLSVSVFCAVLGARETAHEDAEIIQAKDRLVARTYPATRRSPTWLQ